jgi:hypothetical protein
MAVLAMNLDVGCVSTMWLNMSTTRFPMNCRHHVCGNNTIRATTADGLS